MENSIIVQCPCCGMGLEVINNEFLGSRAYPLPTNDLTRMINAAKSNIISMLCVNGGKENEVPDEANSTL